MAATNKATVFLSGIIYWAKVLGEPVPNYAGDAREWTLEFEPDEDGVKELKKHGLTDRLKDKYEDRGKFLVLRKSELTKDGNPNKPLRIYDGDNNEWPSQDKKIGNKSKGDIKLDIRDYGVGKKKGVYPVALRVTELVEYQSEEFGDFGKPSGNSSKDTFKEDFGLDDEVPF